MTHEVEVPAFDPIDSCISCQVPLKDVDKKNKRCLCLHCRHAALLEHEHTLIVNYGMDFLRTVIAKIKYHKYNNKRKLLNY